MLNMGANATRQPDHESERRSTEPDVAALLARRVRELRTAAGLSVTDIARTSGVSRRMVTLIEAGDANPSVLILDRVATALGTALAELLLPAPPSAAPGAASTTAVAYPMVKAVTVLTLDGGGTARLRARTPNAHGPELWTWTLNPGDVFAVDATNHSGDMLYLVTSGRLHLYAGDELLDLDTGDSAWVRTDTAHQYSNPGPRACEFVQLTHAAPS